jgi:hypothetical protein
MSFYSLPNLSAAEVQPCEPWLAQPALPALADKTAYRVWCNNPLTSHSFITAFQGRIPGIRVSETNPPVRMAGLIIDYDAVPDVPPEQSIMAKAPSDLRPAWVSRTFSGHCRVLYRFEQPVAIFTPDIARQFVLKLQREFKLRRLLAGFEEEALIDLTKHYEIGRDWTPIGGGDNLIPSNLLMAWLAEASGKHRWDREGPTIPIDVIREEAIKRFPEAVWPGGWSNFELGARGPRFWDADAGDPTAAVVRESGMQYYSDGGGFLTWETVFGSQFVRRWADDRIGSAIQNYFYDGKDYWTKSHLDGKWGTRAEREVHRALRIRHRLFKKAPSPNEESEVERALLDITELRRVDVALPFVFRPDGPIESDGSTCLNISTRRPVLPHNDTVEWGEGFPRLANWLGYAFPAVPGVDGAADPNRQLNHLLAFTRHFYLGALHQEPQRGLALFLAGPASAGKNFFNKAVLGRLMGGSQDASKYLMSEDKFNDMLFGVAHWRIDDAIASTDEKEQRRFSQMVKQVVANDSLVYRRMYSGGRDIEWIGRVVVTMNDDPESLRVLPQTDIHILDKIMLLKLQSQPGPGWEMTDAQIDAELPFFAAFLRDWVPPAYCLPADPRFGVAAYAHPDLLASANSTNVTASFEELLTLWREWYFAPGAAGEDLASWVGNPTELGSAITLNEGLRHSVGRAYSAVQIGIHLSKLVKQGRPYLVRLADRRYEIARPV